MPPTGFGAKSRHILENMRDAVLLFISEFYHGQIAVTITLTKTERNQRIREQYNSGSTLAELASMYGVSIARVHQIIHDKRK